jgi:methyltransferase
VAGLSGAAYSIFLALVGAFRLLELRISKRNQREMEARGARKAKDPVYPWMVALHTGTLAACAGEVWALERLWPGAIGWSAVLIWALSNVLRVWVIRTLAVHWNTQVMASAPLGVISSGPYRWIRHPNYVAVFFEMIAIPAIHGAWLTMIVTTVCHVAVLAARIRAEDRVLLADPEYRAAMGNKPRFLPGWGQ